MSSKRIESLAGDFWEAVGGEVPFPRNLEEVIQTSKPVSIIQVSGLCLGAIRQWLVSRGHRFDLNERERRLNGCLAAFQGNALVFVEADLSADDNRMIVAHEFAHYLADYEHPRERLRRRLGPPLLAVLDGVRSPTASERIEATLAGVELGTHVHYMERTAKGTYTEPTNLVEHTANELALELIAPRRTVLQAVRDRGIALTNLRLWIALLRKSFGLPTSWTVPYARRLIGLARARRSFSETLGL